MLPKRRALAFPASLRDEGQHSRNPVHQMRRLTSAEPAGVIPVPLASSVIVLSRKHGNEAQTDVVERALSVHFMAAELHGLGRTARPPAT